MERQFPRVSHVSEKGKCEEQCLEIFRKNVQFKEEDPQRIPRRRLEPVAREAFLRDWPRPPSLFISSSAEEDPFPLFQPDVARYFDEEESRHQRKKLPSDDVRVEENAENISSDDLSGCHDDEMIGKKYVYTHTGTIKDLYYLFRPTELQQNVDNQERGSPNEVNRQKFLTMAGGALEDPLSGKYYESTIPTGCVEGWDEDEDSAVYRSHRMREVDFFVKQGVWSVDPIGDWSHLKHEKVPKDFLRKLRRYFEMRPLEYLEDTGSYRMFHVLNQYKDLRKIFEESDWPMRKVAEGMRNWRRACCGKKSAIEEARKMELDYLALIWLSIWDPRLKENVFQIREMSMSDCFFTRVGWSAAIGVKDLLTKNELHSTDDLWEQKKRRQAVDERDPEELRN